MIRKLEDLITDKISGEWGNEGTPETGVKVIRTANFTNGGVINFDNLVYREIDPKKVAAKRLQTGDIIIEKSGGSPTQPVGRVVFFDLKTDEPFLCNNFTSVLRPNKKLVYPKYLFYRLFEGHKEGRTLKYQNKTTGIINLKLENYLQEKLDIPDDLQDQIRIANILSKAEALINQRKESLRLLDELLKSTFLEMFGDPIKNPKGWEIKAFGDIIESIRYGTSTPPEYKSEGIPFIRATNVKKGRVSTKDLVFISEVEAAKIPKCKLNEGDLIIVRSGANTGDAVTIPKEFKNAYAGYDLVITLNQISSIFYNELINSEFGRTKIKPLTQRSGQPHLNAEQVKGLKFYHPPFKLQTQFAHIVEKTEALKVHYQNSLQELENLYGSLSQRAFKGELSLKGEVTTYAEALEDTLAMAAEPKTGYKKQKV